MPKKYNKLTPITEDNKYSKNIYNGGIAVYFGNTSKQYASKDPTKYLSQYTKRPPVTRDPSMSGQRPLQSNQPSAQNTNRPPVTRDPGMSVQRPLPSNPPSAQNRTPVTKEELKQKLARYIKEVESLRYKWFFDTSITYMNRPNVEQALRDKFNKICKIQSIFRKHNSDSQAVKLLASKIFDDNDAKINNMAICLKPLAYKLNSGGKKYRKSTKKPASKRISKKK
jgi:hypothetical protein